MSQKTIEKRQCPPPSTQMPDQVAANKVRICTYRPGMPKADFYIQSKGNNAGQVLSSAIPNCWAVYTNVPKLKQIAFSLFKSGALKHLVIGSVIPFMRLFEYRPMLEAAASKAGQYNPDLLRTLEMIEAQSENLEQQAKLIRQYQTALAYKINFELKVIQP